MILKRAFVIGMLLMATVVISCKEQAKVDDSQMKKVMAIHDEAMPKMSKIGSLVAQLKKRIDTDQGGVAEKEAMEDLQEAHETMMEWMRGFGGKFDSDEILNGKELTAEKKVLLDEEEAKVKIVKEKIETSIANAEALLHKSKE